MRNYRDLTSHEVERLKDEYPITANRHLAMMSASTASANWQRTWAGRKTVHRYAQTAAEAIRRQQKKRRG